MARSQADLLAINTEITTDPDSLGYLPHVAENDKANSEAMNLKRDRYSSTLARVEPDVVGRAIDWDEYDNLTGPRRSRIAAMLSMPRIDLAPGSEDRRGLDKTFGDGSSTRDNLLPLLSQSVPASRVEKMWQDGLLEVGGRVEPADLADPGLGLIKRRILEKSNALLGKPLLRAVVFSEFSYMEQ